MLVHVVYRLTVIRREGFNGLRELTLLGLAFFFTQLARIAIGVPSFHWTLAYSRRINLMPLKTIRGFLEHREVVTGYSFVTNLFGNALLFLPFGFLAPILFNRFRNPLKMILYGFLISLTIEVIQLIFGGHAFDVDDLILNTISVLPGYALYKLLGLFSWFRAWLVRAGDEGETTFGSFYKGWVSIYATLLLVTLAVTGFFNP